MTFPRKSGPEFLVNTFTLNEQYTPSIAGLSNGGFVVIWASETERSGFSQSAIRAQVYTANGTASGAEILVNLAYTTDGDPFARAFESSVSALDNGRFAITWKVDFEPANDYKSSGIRAQIFNGDGTEAGPEFGVNTIVANEQFHPTIAALVDGRFVLSWIDKSQSDDDTSGTAIRAQVFNSDGSKAGAEFLVNTTTASFQYESTITGLADGRFVVSWTDGDERPGFYQRTDVRAQIFNGDGSKSGAEFQVNTTTFKSKANPSIATLEDGRFIVSWTDFSKTGDDTSSAAIRAQLFNADGTFFGAEFLVNTTTAYVQTQPDTAALADGRFVITWMDYDSPGGAINDLSIRAQVFNSDGSKAGGEFLVNTTNIEIQRYPTITALTDGRFVISWMDDSETGGDTSDNAIRAQIFDPREAAVTLVGTGLDDDFVGTRFDDDMSGLAGDDLLRGRGGDDDLRGGAGRDVLRGGKGDDFLSGGKGRDIVAGGAGDDRLLGNGGADTLVGGMGRDRMTGGADADRFVFRDISETGTTAATRDVIRDFSQGQGDVIDLSRIDAGTSDQAFSFAGASAFSSVQGELRFFQTANNTIVQGDVDGDGVADFTILLNGVIDLTADDFIL